MSILRVLCLAIVILLVSNRLYSQERFERQYPSGAEHHLAFSLDNSGETLYMLSVDKDDDNRYTRVNLTLLDNKGTISWSRVYDYGDTLKIRSLGEVISMYDGGIAFTVALQRDSLNKLVTRLDPNGNVLWAQVTGDINASNDLEDIKSTLVDIPDEQVFHSHILASEKNDGIDALLSAYDYEGALLWSRRFTILSDSLVANERILDMQFTKDSAIFILGTTGLASKPIFLNKMTKQGDLLWSRSYKGDFSNVESTFGYSLAELVDGSLVILGSTDEIGAQLRGGFVLHVDSNGKFIKSKRMASTNPRKEIFANELIGMLDTTVVIGIKSLDRVNNKINPMIIRYDLDSTILYQTSLDSSISNHINISGLTTIDSMNVVFLTTASYPNTQLLTPYVTKLDNRGKSNCEEPTEIVRFDSIHFFTDTLKWAISDINQTDSIRVLTRQYGGYNPPTLTLQDTTFCPQDPVIFLVDATVRGGAVYLWDDNNTDSVRVFLKDGTYSVTVTVVEDLCFTLCDTTTINVIERPEVQIAKNFSNYCATGKAILAAIPMGQITSIEWSTGAKNGAIFIDSPGTYIVKVTDVCGNTATDFVTIDADEFNIQVPVLVSESDANVCVNNTIRIQVTNFASPTGLSWSNGARDVFFIDVNAPGTYTVTFDGICDGTKSVTISPDRFLEKLTVQIDEVCQNPILLTSKGTGIVSRVWNTGSTAESISIVRPGTYSISVKDKCGNTEIASSNWSFEKITSCIPPIPCLQWPNIFIPASNTETNRSFGPKSDCVQIDSYELRIYNRWGKDIWSTTNFSATWDGQINGEDAPSDIYFYWAKYNIGSETFKNEGDVTLLR